MSSFFTLTAPQKITLGVLGAALLSFSMENAAQAAVLFNNNAPDLQSAIRSDFSFPVEAGDDFTFASSNDITRIKWSGIYANSKSLLPVKRPSADSFSIRIFSLLQDAKGGKIPAIDPLITFKPDAISRTNSGTQIKGASNTDSYKVYNYALNLAVPFTLGAGAYLLSIVNNNATPDDDWFWATSKQDGNDFGRFQPSTAWFDDLNTAELSFVIRGNATPVPPTPSPAPSPNAVPTPALLPGLIGFGLSVWRKRRSATVKQSTENN